MLRAQVRQLGRRRGVLAELAEELEVVRASGRETDSPMAVAREDGAALSDSMSREQV